jgi:hypothetical protein
MATSGLNLLMAARTASTGKSGDPAGQSRTSREGLKPATLIQAQSTG